MHRIPRRRLKIVCYFVDRKISTATEKELDALDISDYTKLDQNIAVLQKWDGIAKQTVFGQPVLEAQVRQLITVATNDLVNTVVVEHTARLSNPNPNQTLGGVIQDLKDDLNKITTLVDERKQQIVDAFTLPLWQRVVDELFGQIQTIEGELDYVSDRTTKGLYFSVSDIRNKAGRLNSVLSTRTTQLASQNTRKDRAQKIKEAFQQALKANTNTNHISVGHVQSLSSVNASGTGLAINIGAMTLTSVDINLSDADVVETVAVKIPEIVSWLSILSQANTTASLTALKGQHTIEELPALVRSQMHIYLAGRLLGDINNPKLYELLIHGINAALVSILPSASLYDATIRAFNQPEVQQPLADLKTAIEKNADGAVEYFTGFIRVLLLGNNRTNILTLITEMTNLWNDPQTILLPEEDFPFPATEADFITKYAPKLIIKLKLNTFELKTNLRSVNEQMLKGLYAHYQKCLLKPVVNKGDKRTIDPETYFDIDNAAFVGTKSDSDVRIAAALVQSVWSTHGKFYFDKPQINGFISIYSQTTLFPIINQKWGSQQD